MEDKKKGYDIKIQSEEEILWEKVVKESKEIIKKLNSDLIINKEILKMAESKLASMKK